MRSVILLFIFSVFTSYLGMSQYCRDGDYPMPVFSPETREKMVKQLSEARRTWETSNQDKDALIWYARRMAYLGHYREAISLYTKGLRLWPEEARFLRHRGHRYITLRCNREAIADLKKADSIVQNKSDEIEPDGMPNALNIPLSTLKSNIRYHLGLAYFLKGDLAQSGQAWRECLTVSNNPDMFIATAYWLYVTLRLAGKEIQAQDLLNQVNPNLQLIENVDYYNILLLYKGILSEKSLFEKLSGTNGSLSNATLGFALGLYFHIKGQKVKAREFFSKVLKTSQWSSFGFIGAEKFIQDNPY